MIYTLSLCLGMFLGLCGEAREFDYPTYEACAKERDVQLAIKNNNIKRATCSPKPKEGLK